MTHFTASRATTILIAATATAALPSPSAIAQSTPIGAATTCAAWGSWDFFRTAAVDTVASCLRSGADPLAALDEAGGTPLHHAARAASDPAVVAALLEAGADVNAANRGGLTPLHMAATWNRNAAVVVALVEAGADLDARDVRGNTPLHAAWDNPSPDNPYSRGRANRQAVEVLLGSGADSLARNDRGEVADPTSCELWPTPAFAHATDREAFVGCLEAGADIGATDYRGNTVLHHAAFHPDPSVTALLLGSGADAAARNESGATPLHVAAEHDNAEIATTLIAAGADVDAQDEAGRASLHAAAWNRSARVLNVLLAADAAVDVRTGEDATPLIWALRQRGRDVDPTIVTMLLEAGADVNLAETFFGGGPLHEVLMGHPSDEINRIALDLLARGADPNAVNRSGWTALHIAAYDSGPELIRAMVEAGADPQARDGDGESPLHPAARHGEPAAIVALAEAGAELEAANEDGQTALHQAVGNGRADNVAALLLAGASVHARTAEGDTPLHLAAAGSGAAIVSALADAGADANARNARGRTPLHAAWQHDNPAAIERLLALGADPETEDDQGRTPGPSCDWSDYDFFRHVPVESVRGCIAAGTPLDAPDEYGQLPLHRVASYPRGDVTLAIANLLLEAGADVNQRGARDRTPLHAAAGSGDGTALARGLLERGADVDARDLLGRTPLHAATSSGWGDGDGRMVSLLAEAGADVNARSASGATPLHGAVRFGGPVIAERLLELGADPTLRDDSSRVADPLNCENWNTRAFVTMAGADIVAACLASGAEPGAATGRLRGFHSAGMPGATTLHLASAAARDTAVITVLLEAGADLLARDEAGHQPLHRAAQSGALGTVRTLLRAGADVTSRARGFSVDYGWDWTPLHLAAWQNPDPRVAEALLQAGADLHAPGYAGETPLHQAALNRNPAVAALLLEAGADVNARGSTGWSPLHAAAENANPAVLDVLIRAGAVVHARATHPESHLNQGNMTPMHRAAAANESPAVLTALVEAGADVNARVTEAAIPFRMVGSGATIMPQERGSTALHLAASHFAHPEVIESLVRGGADMELRDRTGRTPLHVAARHNAAAFKALLDLGADPTALDDDGYTPMDHARDNPGLQGLPEVMRLRGSPVRPPPPGPAPAAAS